MKRLMLGVVLSLTFVSPAYGDNDDDYDHRDCENSKDCSDEDFSPTFTDSPVNIWICLPGSTCNPGGE